MSDLYKNAGEYMPDKLIVDMAIPITSKGIKVAKGEGILKRGTLMGPAGDGTYKRTDTEDGEGEKAVTIGADCILTDDVDATNAAVVTTAYVSGCFNAGALILPEGKKISGHETTLRQLGIYLRAVQEY